MSQGLWLWEVPSAPGRSAEERNVSRSVALGASIFCIPRGVEAPGARGSANREDRAGALKQPLIARSGDSSDRGLEVREAGSDECHGGVALGV